VTVEAKAGKVCSVIAGEGKLTYLVSAIFHWRKLVETNYQISNIRWECTKLGKGDTY